MPPISIVQVAAAAGGAGGGLSAPGRGGGGSGRGAVVVMSAPGRDGGASDRRSMVRGGRRARTGGFARFWRADCWPRSSAGRCVRGGVLEAGDRGRAVADAPGSGKGTR